jgi:hypothetical protein
MIVVQVQQFEQYTDYNILSKGNQRAFLQRPKALPTPNHPSQACGLASPLCKEGELVVLTLPEWQ